MKVTQELAPILGDLASFDAMRRTHPLQMWRAWDSPRPATSQLRALQEIVNYKELAIFGGNRSGKTELGRIMLVALVLGADHPDAAAFWRRHGIDPKELPFGPDDGWIVATSSGDSIRYHRKQILALLPKWGPRHPYSKGEGSNIHSWGLYGKGEALLECMVPGYETPARIYFKTEDQGEDAFQGDAVRAIHHDEEGKTEKVFTSASYRLIDKDGWQILTNTPIYGKTWTYRRFEKERPPTAKLVRIHSKDNPHLPKGRVAKFADDAVRGKGEYVEAEGRVWPMFSEDIHVVKPFALPVDTRHYKAIDFGTRHPFAVGWATRLRDSVRLENGRVLHDGTIVVYREHYLRGQTTAYHVARMRQYEGWRRKEREDSQRPHEAWEHCEEAERISMTWADPEDPQQIMQMRQLYGMPITKARRARQAGIDLVADYLAPDDMGEPRLVIFDTCLNFIREVGGYEWTDRQTADGADKKEPSDESDHTCDVLRYLVMGIVRGTMTP